MSKYQEKKGIYHVRWEHTGATQGVASTTDLMIRGAIAFTASAAAYRKENSCSGSSKLITLSLSVIHQQR